MTNNTATLSKYKTGIALDHLNEFIMWILLLGALLIDIFLIYFNNDIGLKDSNNETDKQKKYKVYYNKYLGAWLNSGKWIYKLDNLIAKVWRMNFNKPSEFIDKMFDKIF